MTMMGDPEQIFGPDEALESLLELLAKVNLSPNRVKFQCIGTTDGALDNAPDWLIFDKSPCVFFALCYLSNTPPPWGREKNKIARRILDYNEDYHTVLGQYETRSLMVNAIPA